MMMMMIIIIIIVIIITSTITPRIYSCQAAFSAMVYINCKVSDRLDLDMTNGVTKPSMPDLVMLKQCQISQ
jgi:hypothetical protein